MKIIVEIAKTDLVQLIASLHDKMQIDINATELEPKLTCLLNPQTLALPLCISSRPNADFFHK